MSGCSQCGAPDHEIPIPGAGSQHFVRPEIRRPRPKNPRVTTPADAAKGWRHKVIQGQDEHVRSICVNCLNDNEIRDQVWGEMKRTALQLEKKPNPDADFYALLCN